MTAIKAAATIKTKGSEVIFTQKKPPRMIILKAIAVVGITGFAPNSFLSHLSSVFIIIAAL